MPSLPYRILYLIPSLQVGGTEKSLLTLLNQIDRTRVEPELCCTQRDGPLLDDARALGIPLHCLQSRQIIEWGGLRQLLGLMRRRHYCLMHTFLLEAEIYGRIAALVHGRVPCVSTIANSHPWQVSRSPKDRTKNAVARLTMRYLTTRVISKSAILAEYYQTTLGYTLPGLTIIPNGIPFDGPEWSAPPTREEARRTLGISDSTIVVLNVASLTEKKDQRMLFAAWARLPRTLAASLLLLIAGEGPLLDALQDYAQELGIAETVRFLGYCKDIPAVWAAADIGVSSSVREGLPNVLLEAGAMGRPVVATAVGGVAEIVCDGTTGLLVPARDPDALAAALTRLVTNEQERAAMGAAAATRVRTHFDAAAVARHHEALYTAILEGA